MTEQEVVNILKENKTKGIAFNFMPKEVRDWCCNRPNYFNDFLQYKNGAWRDEYRFVNPSKDLKEMALEEIIILALPDSFRIQQEKNGEWVEFDIDQKGNFHCFMNGDMHYFFWANWNAFLTEAHSFGYTAFGGWQYEEDGEWFTSPQMATEGSYTTMVTYDEYCKPAIPVKIRFWRES